MRWWWQQNLEYAAEKRREENLGSSGRDLDRKYWIALLLYGVATFALRTVLVRQADKIRHGGE